MITRAWLLCFISFVVLSTSLAQTGECIVEVTTPEATTTFAATDGVSWSTSSNTVQVTTLPLQDEVEKKSDAVVRLTLPITVVFFQSSESSDNRLGVNILLDKKICSYLSDDLKTPGDARE